MTRKWAPLTETHPELAEEAYGWDPTCFGKGMSISKNWRGPLGHIWKTYISTRVNGATCWYCKGARVLPGFNDLKETHPGLASQAYNWDPTTLMANSGKNVGWRCHEGHIWHAVIRFRSGIAGNLECSTCANRTVETGFNDLKKLFPKVSAEAYGWDPSLVKPGSQSKKTWKCPLGHIYQMAPRERTIHQSYGCHFCSGTKVLKNFNDLATTHPEIARQAYGWDATTVSAGCQKKLQWKCDNGHLWEAKVGLRTNNSHGSTSKCSYCSGRKVLKDFNDLKTTHPDIANEAYGWDPTTATAGESRLKRPWRCQEGHIWQGTVSSRTCEGGHGCLLCARMGGFDPSKPATLYLTAIYPTPVDKTPLGWKIGITTRPSKIRRMAQQNKIGTKYHLETVYEFKASGQEVQEMEKMVLGWWRREMGLPHYLSRIEMPDGYGETVSADTLTREEILEKISCSKILPIE